ncbi:MAG: sulfatase [Planctomycetaceae bacterium]
MSLIFSRIVVLSVLSCAAHRSIAADRPNFVIILADDLGYGDLACYGNTVNRTPHLDRMAAEGIRFTDFHANGPMCSATRAALLTGQYQHRFGRHFEGALSPDSQPTNGLPLEAVTIAEVLKDAGYATGMYGKWHLGYAPPLMPAQQGFDDFRGLASGDGDHFSHIDRSGARDWWHNNEIDMEEGYCADLVTRHSQDFIRRHKDEPFFLYVAHLSIHFPWQGPNDAAYREEGTDYADNKHGLPRGSNVGPAVKAMVESLDASVGEILATLKQQGLDEKTLVVFASDNGGYLAYAGGFHNISSNGPYRGQKTELYEGGHRVPAIMRWPGHIAPGTSDQTVMTFDLFPTLLDLAGLDRQKQSLRLDGVSLKSLLHKNTELPSRPLFWRKGDVRAVRQGPWKLLTQGGQFELYHLGEAMDESHNVADRQPELAGTLVKALDAWEADVDSTGRGR